MGALDFLCVIQARQMKNPTRIAYLNAQRNLMLFHCCYTMFLLAYSGILAPFCPNYQNQKFQNKQESKPNPRNHILPEILSEQELSKWAERQVLPCCTTKCSQRFRKKNCNKITGILIYQFLVEIHHYLVSPDWLTSG